MSRPLASNLPPVDRPAWKVRRRASLGKGLKPYLMVAPAVVIIAGLVLYPLFLSLVTSLRVDNVLFPGVHRFIGLTNYQNVLSDPSFQLAVRNTAIYFLAGSFGVLTGSLIIAMWLHNLSLKWRGFFLTVVILPWAVPGVVTGLLWSFIYNPTTGLLNAILLDLHVINHDIVWLNHPGLNLLLIVIALLWQILPLTSVILLAGLESIPPSIYEAARVDGCHPWHAFTHITLPLIRPALAIAMVQTAVLTIGVFDQVYVLTGYDPSTKSVIIQTYLYAFQNLNLGQGISAAMLVTLGITVVGFIYLRFLYREVSY